jgi:UDP-N-acetylglucosamine diphosphorylase/glucosamine-1-phosphate N-acetyltransferase
MENNLVITILAGGEGKRMNSNIPKVLHLFNGKPMLVKIIEKSLLLKPSKIIIVTGKYNDLIQNTLSQYIDITPIIFVQQKTPLGTGHAIKCCLDYYKPEQKILILNGDMPLINKEVLEQFINSKQTNFNILVAQFSNPTGYGRIIYENNDFMEIIEEKDCNEEQKTINVVNSGLYYIASELLREFIPMITNENKQNEYYLTDIVKIIKSKTNHTIDTFLIDVNDNKYISGVNTQAELKDLDKLEN